MTGMELFSKCNKNVNPLLHVSRVKDKHNVENPVISLNKTLFRVYESYLFFLYGPVTNDPSTARGLGTTGLINVNSLSWTDWSVSEATVIPFISSCLRWNYSVFVCITWHIVDLFFSFVAGTDRNMVQQRRACLYQKSLVLLYISE